MALIHHLIRRGFDQAGEFLLTPTATTRAPALTEYVSFHLDALHAHHTSEDDLIWPALHKRAILSDPLITRMQEQHVGPHDAVASTRAALPAWAAAPTPPGAESLAATLSIIADRLAQHLTEEECDVVPLIAAHITQGVGPPRQSDVQHVHPQTALHRDG